MTTEERNPLREVLGELVSRTNALTRLEAADPLLALVSIERLLGRVRDELIEGNPEAPMLVADPLVDLAADAVVWAARLMNNEPVLVSALLANNERAILGEPIPRPAETVMREPLDTDALDIALGAIEGARERATPGTTRHEALGRMRGELVQRLAAVTRRGEALEEDQHVFEENHR